MNTYSFITFSQAIWLYGTDDVIELNTRFVADATALGSSYRLRAIDLRDAILIYAEEWNNQITVRPGDYDSSVIS